MARHADRSVLRRKGDQIRAVRGPTHLGVGFFFATSNRLLPFRARRDGKAIAVEPRYVVGVNDGGAYLAAGVAGMGILRLPAVLAADERACGGRLVRVLTDFEYEPLPLFAAIPKRDGFRHAFGCFSIGSRRFSPPRARREGASFGRAALVARFACRTPSEPRDASMTLELDHDGRIVACHWGWCTRRSCRPSVSATRMPPRRSDPWNAWRLAPPSCA